MATAAVIVACGDSTTETTPVADAGPDTSVVDTGAPDTSVVDSNVVDSADAAPPECVADANLSTLSPTDAALGEAGSVGTCVACSRTSCAPQLTACQADCDCTNTLSCFFDCIGQSGGSVLGCAQQCGADITNPGPTQDALLCAACSCKTECNVPSAVNSFCPKPPGDASTDAPATDSATDAADDGG